MLYLHTDLLEAAATSAHAPHLSTQLRFYLFVFLAGPSFFLILHLCDVLSFCFAAQALPHSAPPLPSALLDVSEFTSGMNPLPHPGSSRVRRAGEACTANRPIAILREREGEGKELRIT